MIKVSLEARVYNVCIYVFMYVDVYLFIYVCKCVFISTSKHYWEFYFITPSKLQANLSLFDSTIKICNN
jgi:hypothetical protein